MQSEKAALRWFSFSTFLIWDSLLKGFPVILYKTVPFDLMTRLSFCHCQIIWNNILFKAFLSGATVLNIRSMRGNAVHKNNWSKNKLFADLTNCRTSLSWTWSQRWDQHVLMWHWALKVRRHESLLPAPQRIKLTKYAWQAAEWRTPECTRCMHGLSLRTKSPQVTVQNIPDENTDVTRLPTHWRVQKANAGTSNAVNTVILKKLGVMWPRHCAHTSSDFAFH